MSLWEHVESLEAAATAMLLAEVLLRGPAQYRLRRLILDRAEPPPAAPYAKGVVGVGVWRRQPIVLLDGGLINRSEPTRVGEVGELRAALGEALGRAHEFLLAVPALRVPTPESRANSGDSLRGARTGRVGCPVWWSTDDGVKKHGFLTAGHVVGSQTQVTVGGVTASVVFTRTFANSGATPELDVAVVELGVTSAITGAGTARATDKIDVLLGGAAPGQTEVTGKMTWLYFPKEKGTVANLYLAEPSVTSSGDSGTPAVLRQATHEVIGHLVGGSGTVADYIQDVDHQLTTIRQLAPSGSGLGTITI
jgi:hypothetical protein